MADASCSGPSPFKRLIDVQSRDASHHQDRLVERSAAQHHGAFRSAGQQPRGPDNYNAFMDGASSTATVPFMPPDPANRLAVHAAALQQPGAVMNHSYRPEPSQQARASPVPSVTNWAADFARFSNTQQMRSSPVMAGPSSSMRRNQQQPMQTNFQSAFGKAFAAPTHSGLAGAAAGIMGPPQTAPETDYDKEMLQWMSAHGKANMTEVDAAMDQMARELQLNEAALPAEAETTAATAGQDNPPSARYTDLESPEIGNLSLQDSLPDHPPVDAPEAQTKSDGADDLAATTKPKSAVSEAAERLLHSVRHESGEKWQNSVFLSLMRDFRDGRKDIIDNDIHDTEAERSVQKSPAT